MLRVYLLQNKDGQYYNGKLGMRYNMLTTHKVTEAYMCDSISEANVKTWRDAGFDIIPYEFNISQEMLDLVRELRAMAIQCGKNPTHNQCVIALDGLDYATARKKFPEIIDKL